MKKSGKGEESIKMKIKPMIYQADRKIELLYKNEYKNYNYYILNLGTHPTAYIEIPKGHPLYKKHYDKIDIYVHGCLTYSDSELMGIKSTSWFIGWDYAHLGDFLGYDEMYGINSTDKKWTTEEIIEDCENVIEQIIEMEEK